MTIKNVSIIPALPDTWQICASSANGENLGEAIKSQVIAWAIEAVEKSDADCCEYRITPITAFDMEFNHIMTSDERRTYSCDGKNMSPDPETMYEDEVNELL